MYQSGQMFAPLKPQHPIYLQEDFHVSRPVMPEDEEAIKILVGSGLRCCELLKLQGQLSSWQKILSDSLLGRAAFYSTKFIHRWIPKTTKRSNRLLFQLVPYKLRTNGSGCGLLPTPDTCPTAPNKNSNKKYGPRTIPEALTMLPTPTARDHKDCGQLGNVEENALLGRVLKMKHGLKHQPGFALWMMGYPENWLHSARLATQSSRRSRTKSCGKSGS